MKLLNFFRVALLFTVSAVAQASVIPVGIQTNVAAQDIYAAGWDVFYQQKYQETAKISDVFGSLASGDWIMLGALNNSENTFETIAAVTWGEFSTYTALNTAHEFNGVQWYFNGNSMGYLEVGGLLNQFTADNNCTSEGGAGCANADAYQQRLSWHTNYGNSALYSSDQNADVTPTIFGAGWRAGEVTGLNNSADYSMVVLVQRAEVAAPASVGLLGLGLLGLIFARRR